MINIFSCVFPQLALIAVATKNATASFIDGVKVVLSVLSSEKLPLGEVHEIPVALPPITAVNSILSPLQRLRLLVVVIVGSSSLIIVKSILSWHPRLSVIVTL